MLCKATALCTLVLFKQCTAAAQPPARDVFKDFIAWEKDKQQYDSAVKLIRSDRCAEGLKMLNGISKRIDFNISKRLYVARWMMISGEEGKALNELKLAFEDGLLIEIVKRDPTFSKIKTELEEFYIVSREKYLSSIDTLTLREMQKSLSRDQAVRRSTNGIFWEDGHSFSMVQVDSINFRTLRLAVDRGGWPGAALIGSSQTVSEFESPNLLVLHFSEKENIFFLSKMLEQIRVGRASWWDAYAVMKNLCFRFKEKGLVKLRYVFFDSCSLNLSSSYFQLKMLADYLRDNPARKITMSLARIQDERESEVKKCFPVLAEIKKFMALQGINDRVNFSEIVTEFKSDGLGDFRVVYTIH